MTISDAHIQFKERFNRMGTNYHQDLSPYQIDSLLWDGLMQLVEKITEQPRTTEYQAILSSLLISQPEQPALTSTTTYVDSGFDVTVFDMSGLRYPIYHIERATGVTSCGSINVTVETYNRLPDLLNDSFQRPSKTWKRLLGIYTSSNPRVPGSLHVYSESGLAVTSLFVDYVRLPKRPFFGRYDTPDYLHCQANGGQNCDQFDSAVTLPRDLDIQESLHSKVVDYAVVEALRTLKLGNEMQISAAKVSVNN